MVGLPEMNLSATVLFIVNKDRRSWANKRVRMGITPCKRGIPVFPIGMDASSEIIIATANSKGWSWPI
jgi:hypothetical protein